MTETTLKRCGVCGAKKPLADFALHNRSHDGHRRVCIACGERYGYRNISHKRQTTPVPVPAPVAPPPTTPVAPAITPMFVVAGGYRFGLSSIAMVDARQQDMVEIKLNIHEVNGHGYPEALSFSFEGTEAALLLAAIDNVTGQADAEIEALKTLVKEAWEERDAALKLAEELEKKQKALRSALGM